MYTAKIHNNPKCRTAVLFIGGRGIFLKVARIVVDGRTLRFFKADEDTPADECEFSDERVALQATLILDYVLRTPFSSHLISMREISSGTPEGVKKCLEFSISE